MKRIVLSLLIAILCQFTIIIGQTPAAILTKKHLTDSRHSKRTLAELTERKPFVLIFLAADCPISQKYIPIIQANIKKYSPIKFLPVFTKWESDSSIMAFNQSYPLSCETFKDRKNTLVKTIQARITPEAFFYDEKGQLLYRGAIDDWYYALGKYRQEPSELYLNNAIEAYLNHQDIKIKKTDAIGCVIEY